MCSWNVFKEALNKMEDGIIINGAVVNNLRSTDDAVLIADRAYIIQIIIDRLATACNSDINCKKCLLR